MPHSRDPKLATDGGLIDQRYAVICRALGITPAAAADRESRLVEQLRARGLAWDQTVYLLWQLFLARIPTRIEVDVVARRMDEGDPRELCQYFRESEEFRRGSQARIHFRTPPASTLLVDVTHTLTYPYNSGIQRVVRSTVRQFQEQRLAHALVVFDDSSHAYRMLEGDAAARILDWERLPTPASGVSASAASARPLIPPASPRRRRGLKNLAERLVGEHVSGRVREWLRRWKQNRRRKDSVSSPSTASPLEMGRPAGVAGAQDNSVLFLWDQPILFPELMTDLTRLERVASLLRHSRLDSSLVLYDLIPLHSPDLLGGNVDGFIRFLTLLRSVERVSCITRSVESELRQLLPLVVSDHRPRIATHHLGADFDFAADAPSGSVGEALPVVLCVGTFEVRKNHRRILAGMVRAQRQGARFRGIFVGNPGWMGEEFVADVTRLRHQGYTVETRQSVRERELQQLLAQSACTVFCSLAEGFGLPVVESVMKGVPCITSNRGSMKEVGERMGGCLLVDPESEQQIARGIEELLSASPLAERLRGEAAQATWPAWRDYARQLHAFACSRAEVEGVDQQPVTTRAPPAGRAA